MHLDPHTLHSKKVWVGGLLKHQLVAKDKHSGRFVHVHHKRVNGVMTVVPLHTHRGGAVVKSHPVSEDKKRAQRRIFDQLAKAL